MKNMLKNIGIIVLGLALVAISASPALVLADDDLVAAIIAPASGSSFQVGETITFRAQASGGTAPYAYVWNFGDGTQGGGQNFTKTYTANAVGPRTVRLTVTDFATRIATDTITININQAPTPTPTVDLKVNNSNGPVTINAGTSANLTWTSTNATICTATGAWTGTRAVTGSQSTGSLAVGNYTYTLTCTGAGSSVTDAVTVNVVTSPVPTPTIDLKVNGSNGPVALNQGANATLSWTSANVTACTATGAWTGIKPTTGSETTNALNNGTYTYNLSCKCKCRYLEH